VPDRAPVAAPGAGSRRSRFAQALDIAPRLDGQYIPSLDGIRAVAFSTVFVAHAGASLVPGGFGVTTFFFLSGYLITTLLRNELAKSGGISVRNFYARRAIRILPPMYAAMLVAVVCDHVRFCSATENWWTLALQAAHLANYTPYLSSGGGPAGTGVLWSLAVEEHFYLLYPILFTSRATLGDHRRLAWLLVGVCIATLAWRIFLASQGFSLQYIQHATDTRIASLAFGCIMGLVADPHRRELGELSRTTKAIMVAAGCGLLVLSFAWRNQLFRGTAIFTVQGVGLAPLFYLAVSEPKNLVHRALNWLPLRCLGTLSYSAYLLHDILINAVEQNLRWTGVAAGAMAFVGTIAAAYAMYFIVERPCARLRQMLRAA
jgi:peptidoglycan/LPS O-acetylase OafA/YrhL